MESIVDAPSVSVSALATAVFTVFHLLVPSLGALPNLTGVLSFGLVLFRPKFI
jgi:hypothetical protein